MKKQTKTKFYLFDQNNSGGFFDVNENVCHRVVIEAADESQAQSIFAPMIKDQSASCPCCGDRWSPEYADEIDLDEYKKTGYPVGVYDFYDNPEKRWRELYGEFPSLQEPIWITKFGVKEFSGLIYFNTIEQYLQYLANAYGWTNPDARIHYLDGTKKEIFSKLVD